MTIPEIFEEIARRACPGFAWYYDIRRMQNVTADNCGFPLILMEEYYASRLVNRYGWQRELTVEFHFLNLVPMQGEAPERERVREAMFRDAVVPFVAAVLASGQFKEVTEYTCDPEPPLFDANATGLLLRITVAMPLC